MKKAFTITELLVAVGLLAVILASCGVIFNYSINAMRTASATSEIMRNLRAITDQLDADFAGLRESDAKMFVGFSSSQDPPFADSIVFFATGDFQTTNTYSGDIIRGNVARIYYGQAGYIAGVCPNPLSPDEKDRRNKILARKQVILAPAEPNFTDEYNPNSFFQEARESFDEDTNTCSWLKQKPDIDPNDEDDIPMYLAKGVDNFSIAVDNDVNSTNYSIEWWPQPGDRPTKFENRPKEYPDLIKFTFTLYDSKGILKNGRRFEYIVYIGK